MAVVIFIFVEFLFSFLFLTNFRFAVYVTNLNYYCYFVLMFSLTFILVYFLPVIYFLYHC